MKNKLLYTIICMQLICTYVAVGQSNDAPFIQYSLQKSMVQSTPLKSLEAIEQISVDPDSYILGSGDKIEIRASKLPQSSFIGSINEAGTLFIPELGAFSIGKTNLTHTISMLKTKLSPKIDILGDLYITLLQIKTVSVVVSGVGVNSGTYKLPGNLRILDAIRAANSDTLPNLSEINLRQVSIASSDTTIVVDLLKFIATGSLQENPYVYPGIAIHLAYIQKYAYVSGQIQTHIPNKIPIKEHETIGSILSLFGFSPSADTSAIILQRYNMLPGTYGISKIRSIPLNHLDCIIVSSYTDKKQLFTVTISGEVIRPGIYPIEYQKTTAQQIIKQAGGPTTIGDIQRAYVVKKSMHHATKNNAISNSVPSIEQTIVIGSQKMVYSQDFTILPLFETDITLTGDEEITIPKKEITVFISGSVKNPGPYLYEPDKKISFYIREAGGIAPHGDKKNIRIIALYGTDYQVLEKTRVNPGEIILVPEKTPNKLINQWSPVLQIIATSIGIGLSLYSGYILLQ